MKIEVTHEDIQLGIGRDCFRCAVSRAIHRALTKLDDRELCVYVNPYGGMFTSDEDLGIFIFERYSTPHEGQQIACPDEVVEFAQDFDEWYDFQCCNEEERREWNEERDNPEDYEPYEPAPFVFELPLLNPTESDERRESLD